VSVSLHCVHNVSRTYVKVLVPWVYYRRKEKVKQRRGRRKAKSTTKKKELKEQKPKSCIVTKKNTDLNLGTIYFVASVFLAHVSCITVRLQKVQELVSSFV